MGNEEREKRKIEKGSRERIEIERKEKETKGSRDDNLKRKRRNITTFLCLLFSFLTVVLLRRHEFPTRFCSKALRLQQSGLVKGLARETSDIRRMR